MESYKDIKIFSRDQITPNSVMLHGDMVAVQNVESNFVKINDINNVSPPIEKINSGIINLYKVIIGSAAGQALNSTTVNYQNKFLISIDNEIQFFMQRQGPTSGQAISDSTSNYGMTIWPILKSSETTRAMSMRYTAYRTMDTTARINNAFKTSRHNAVIAFPGANSSDKGNYVYISTDTLTFSQTGTTNGITSTEVTAGAFLVLDIISDYTASRGNPKRYEITIQFTDNTTTFLVGIRKLA